MLKYFIYLCCILKLSQTQNFPTHTDLQKVGIVDFKGERYSVLKPSVHVIKDYFKDFVLKQKSVGIPSAKVFLDNNGFRHYWTSFVGDSPGKPIKRQLKATKNGTASGPRSGKGPELKTTFLCPFLGVISTTHYQEAETRRRHHSKKHHKKHHH